VIAKVLTSIVFFCCLSVDSLLFQSPDVFRRRKRIRESDDESSPVAPAVESLRVSPVHVTHSDVESEGGQMDFEMIDRDQEEAADDPTTLLTTTAKSTPTRKKPMPTKTKTASEAKPAPLPLATSLQFPDIDQDDDDFLD
jgi:hypothetical protein